jgi:hypothetical protein
MDKVKAHAMRLWSLALDNKKATGVIAAIIIILIILN